MATRTGCVDLPLHGGHVPPWLFARMVRLSQAILSALVEEFGTEEVLRRLSDPCWFQALGCLLGFDWHSSGLTTTTCGALKTALGEIGQELGLFGAGGKGAVSRETPREIQSIAERIGLEPAPLIYASRLSAKVDSVALQDGFQIYQHAFFFDQAGQWCVVQQGMHKTTQWARRYHWLSAGLQSFVVEPHAAVVGAPTGLVLNLVAQEAKPARDVMPELAQRPPDVSITELKRLQTLTLPERHVLLLADIDPRRLESVFLRAYEAAAPDFERLLGVQGLGAKGLRALALLAELLYGAPASFRDPARFSFAHGGKDGTPYPVDCAAYDRTIAVLERAVHQARLGEREKLAALRRIPLLFRSP